MSPLSNPMDFLYALDRYRFLMIMNAAQECKEYQFAKQASMLWLVNFPGDLYVQYYQALAYSQLGKQNQANELFEGLAEKDPFFIEPVRALSERATSADKRSHFKLVTLFLAQTNPPKQSPDDWIRPLWEARSALSQGNFDNALQLIHQSLIKNPPSPIPAILHLKTANKMDNQEMLTNLSEIYYQKWPKVLQINIIKALTEINQGKESEAVERLHWVAAHDSSGQVIQGLMGKDHRFQNLWPDRLEIVFDLPIPASVSAYLGWNQFEPGPMEAPEFKQAAPNTKSNQKTTGATQKIHIGIEKDLPVNKELSEEEPPAPQQTISEVSAKNWATEEDFEEIQKVFSRLAKRLKKPELDRADNRFPVYVILTAEEQLKRIYGPNTAEIIDTLLKDLVSSIQKLPDWGALLFYPDSPAQMSQLGLKPTNATDAWQIKLVLSDLDKSLAKRGEMIGAVLIVGGPEIVPFHHLPNPTSDNDLDVPSDNPYATVDENYFIPQWPVGRLPGETGADAGLLLHQIRQLLYRYEKKSKNFKSGQLNLASLFNWVFQLFVNMGNSFSKQKKLGYSAEIWRDASAGVFKLVGKEKDLQLSPPIDSKTFIVDNNRETSLGYFNLHGIRDGANWYGQKDFTSPSDGPDYPIALSPGMFNENNPSPKLILTEACYGANVSQKQHEEALSLKCLDSGTTSFVGSTCIAYGSIAPPLIAADFLAAKFWEQMLQGQPAGYALMQAKLSLAEEMTRMQGFLDGEDQKTILSFVLLGDPLAAHDGLQAMPKPLFRLKSHPAVRTISDSDMEQTTDSKEMPRNVNNEVKKVVKKYLPGLENAQMQFNKSGPSKKGESNLKALPERYVVTLKQSFDHNHHTAHHHFARMTFNQKGKLVKFTTSR